MTWTVINGVDVMVGTETLFMHYPSYIRVDSMGGQYVIPSIDIGGVTPTFAVEPKFEDMSLLEKVDYIIEFIVDMPSLLQTAVNVVNAINDAVGLISWTDVEDIKEGVTTLTEELAAFVSDPKAYVTTKLETMKDYALGTTLSFIRAIISGDYFD